MGRRSEHPRLARFLTAWLLVLAGSVVGIALFCAYVGAPVFSFGMDGILDAVLLIVALVVLPFVVAVLGPLFASGYLATYVWREPAGSPSAVMLIMTLSGLFYLLLIGACRTAFSDRWPWMRWVWRVCLIALSALETFALTFLGGQ